MKRNFLAVLLFLCLAIPIAGTFVALKHQKKIVRKEIKRKIIAGINRNELVLLKFSEEEKQTLLKWKHSKEFQYKSEMYDIVETEIKADTTYYWCWLDREETRLNQQLNELLSYVFSHYPQNAEKQNKLLQFFKSLYIPNDVEYQQLLAEYCNKTHFLYSNLYLSFHIIPASPPPQHA